MKVLKRKSSLWVVIGGIIVLMAACRSAAPVDFYTLNVQIPVKALPQQYGKLNKISVGIGSVNLPEYLDRPQIVTLKGPHRLHLSEFHRWAGRLDREIAQVMARNISNLIGTTKSFIFPWNQSEEPDFRVDLKFYHLEGTLGKTLRIQGIWSLAGKEANGKTFDYPFDQKISISGSDYDDMVAACSRGLWELGRKISNRIATMMTMSTHK